MNEDDLWVLHDHLAGAGTDEEALDLFRSFVDAGEWVVAIEQLCDTLDEKELALAPKDARELFLAGSHYGVTRRAFVELTKDVTS